MNEIRNGNFTSSEIVALTGIAKRDATDAELASLKLTNPKSKAKLVEDLSILPKPALTYIRNKNWERKSKRSLSTGTNGRACWWGKVAELKAFNVLPTEYSLSSQITEFHPYIENWCGSKDGLKHDEGLTVYDIKCPFALESFFTFCDCTTIEDVREQHADGEKYFWQLVSNACITGAKYAELIVYCPYKNELEDIKELASNYTEDLNKVAWINFAQDEDLPYLERNGDYQNIHIIRFEVSESDKLFLESRVLKAGELLLQKPLSQSL